MSRKDYAVMLVLMMLASFLGGMCAVFLVGYPAIAKEQPTTKVISAEELRLVDKNGKTRVVISGSLEGAAGSGSGADPEAREGTSGIVLQNTDGTPNVLFRAFANGYPELRFMHSRAQSGPHKGEITMATVLDRHELLFMSNQNGLPSASFGLTTDVEGQMRAMDEAMLGKEKAEIIKKDREKRFGKHKFVQSAFLSLTGGEPYIMVGGEKPFLSLYTQEANARLGLDADNEPSLELTDRNGKLRAVLGRVDLESTHIGSVVQRAPSSLAFFDKTGKVIWSAP